jgi:hypothetical protein
MSRELFKSRIHFRSHDENTMAQAVGEWWRRRCHVIRPIYGSTYTTIHIYDGGYTVRLAMQAFER